MTTSSEPVKQRLYSIDVLKGLIIFLIVGLHIIVASKGNMGESPLPLQYLYLGLMSFFIISGYFYRPERGVIANLKKRTIQIVVATVLAGFILTTATFVWLNLLGQSCGFEDYINATLHYLGLSYVGIDSTIQADYALCQISIGYYFLWVMLMAFYIFYPIADHVYKDKRKGAVAIIILLVITILFGEFFHWGLPFFAQLAPLAAAFMIVGVYFAQAGEIERVERMEVRSLSYWIPLIVAVVVSVVLVYFFHPGTDFDLLDFGEYGGFSVFPYFIEATAVFIVIYYFTAFLAKVPLLSNLFNKFGQHTLGLLLIHGGIAKMIAATMGTIIPQALIPDTIDTIGRVAIFFATLIISMVILHFLPRLVEMLKEKMGKKTE